MDKPPVRRTVGTDIRTIATFIKDAALHDYESVFVAEDVAEVLIARLGSLTAFGQINVTRSKYIPDGSALALPPSSCDLWSAETAFRSPKDQP